VLLLAAMVAALTMMAVATPASATSYAAAAWGSNVAAQLGDGSIIGPETCLEEGGCRKTPAAVSGLSGVTAISGGNDHSLALLSNGTVMAWGSNWVGQLGDGTTTGPELCNEGESACSATPVAVSGLSGVTAISAGGEHSLALLSNGTVMAWGYNFYGQLGNGVGGGTGDVPVAVCESGPEVPCSPGHYLTGVTAISAGEEHSLALLSNGTVTAWGWNVYEQLGDGTETDRRVPVAVSGLSGVTGISAGMGHSLALLSNATVMAWGSDAFGQLGNGTSAISFGVPVAVSGLSGVTGISAGGTHSLSYSASSPPEYGACVKVQADKKGKITVYHGGFTTATCLEISGTKTGKYEWFPGPPVKAKFTTKLKESTTLTQAVVTFETVTKTKVVCKGETGTGEYTGTTTVGNVVDTFTGCESQKYKALQKDKCKTAGHAEGELVTSTLEGTLGWIGWKEGKHLVGNDLFPVGHSGPLLEFSCAGIPVQVRGSVIVKVASGKMLPLTKTETVTFAASGSKQTPEQFEGGVKDVLEFSFGVGAFEQTGLKMTTIQTSEEQLEINWSV
jgi:hypothetical protein